MNRKLYLAIFSCFMPAAFAGQPPENRPPFLNNAGPLDVSEDGSTSLSADLFTNNFDDPDGNTMMSLSITSLPANGVLKDGGDAISSVPYNVPLEGIGSISYTPNPEYNGSDSFTWNASDGQLLAENDAIFNLNVTEDNDSPTANPDTLSPVAEDTIVYSISESELTGNDSKGPPQEDGQTLTIIDVTSPVGGSVSIVGNTVQFQPDADYFGQASFDYTIIDDGNTNGSPDGRTSTATASFTITEVNDDPTANQDTPDSILEDDPGALFSSATLTANDSTGPFNESDQFLTITDVGNANGGTVVLSGGDVIFTPFADYNGPASFDYTVSDNGTTNGSPDSKTSTATVSFNVNEANDDPIAIDDSLASIQEDDVAAAFNGSELTGNDSPGPNDESGQSLTVTDVSNVSGGTAFVSGGNVYFTPFADYNGPASFDYTVSDNGSSNGVSDPKSGTAHATFTVTEVNDVPVASDDIGDSMNEDDPPLTISGGSLTSNDTKGAADEDGQNLTVTDVGNAVGGTAVVINGDVQFTPTPDYSGPAGFDYTVSDDGTTNGFADPKSDVGTMTFIINSVNDDPVANADTVEHYAGQSVKFPVSLLLANDSDPDGGTAAFVGVESAANGTVTTNGVLIFYVPNPGHIGEDSFTYTINDGQGGTATGTVNIVNKVDTSVSGNRSTIETLPGGAGVRLTFYGIPGRTYRVQSTETLTPPAWTDRVSIAADAQGRIEFTDPPPLPPNRFYRTAQP